MKTLATLVQLVALAACFTAYVSADGEVQLTGMRRAMQIAAGSPGQAAITVQAAIIEAPAS
jgi:hypothetical protein